MKKIHFVLMLLLVSSTILFTSCSEDDATGPMLTGVTKVYTLSSVSDATISGTVTFAERNDNATVVTIQLTGTDAGMSHPAHIHANTAAEGGGIIIDLSPVEGATGTSETIVTMLEDGTIVSYDDLLEIDGYVNVHASASDLGTLMVQGDVGQNELTGTSKSYTLNAVSNESISGIAMFKQRMNGETLVEIKLIGTSAGGMHPSHIHMNDAATGGGIAISLTDVNGATGVSKTNVSMLNSMTAITFTQLIAFDGYINVHVSMNDLGTLLAQGNIGSNAN